MYLYVYIECVYIYTHNLFNKLNKKKKSDLCSELKTFTIHFTLLKSKERSERLKYYTLFFIRSTKH